MSKQSIESDVIIDLDKTVDALRAAMNEETLNEDQIQALTNAHAMFCDMAEQMKELESETLIN